MDEEFVRTDLLIGEEALKKLNKSRIAVFGIGGVGSYVVEALVRSGIGHIELTDGDVVEMSNINRQLYALHSTLGKYKVDVACERCKDINPNIEVVTNRKFFNKETEGKFDFSKYDYVVDAIDMVSAKIEIVVASQKANVPVISAMGAGNKLQTAFEVADIYDTEVCPLAKVMRRELKKRGIEKHKVVFSREKPVKTVARQADEQSDTRKRVIGSIAYAPAVAGLTIASAVISDLIADCK